MAIDSAQAFERLTGRRISENLPAFFIFLESVSAAVAPTPRQTEWLRKTAKPWLPSRNRIQHLTLDSLRSHIKHHSNEAAVRRSISIFEPRLSALTDDQIRRGIKLFKPGKNTGATNFAASSILAGWCLATGGFGYKSKPAEGESKARSRVANSIRMAETRSIAEWKRSDERAAENKDPLPKPTLKLV